ncbi:MAG: cysteine desulfurase [Candidatus Woesearchaeota archaeon]
MNEFPILNRKVKGKRLIYLDNAATTQKPKCVIDIYKKYYEEMNANVHRGIHTLSEVSTKEYIEAHKIVGDFINASQEEIIFTKNATEAINLIAYSLGQNLKKGNEVLVTEMEHHSNFVPWQQICKRTGATLKLIPFDKNGKLIIDKNTFGKNTKILALTQMSNVFGTINDIKKITKLAHKHNVVVLVDGAQSIAHIPIDIKQLNCDFFVFSGHKIFGPTGIGVLYGKRNLLEKMEPFLFGGDMVREVTKESSKWNDLPWKFEAGTPPIAEGVALTEAIRWIQKIGMKKIMKHDQELTKYALKKLKQVKDIKILGNPQAGIISFNINNLHPHDIATSLDENGIAIRAGHHCAMPLHKKLGLVASARISFAYYNTKEDIDQLIKALQRVEKVFL